MHASIAARLIVGRAPGSPMQTGQTKVLGRAFSGATAQPQNILDRVEGWTWTSIPMSTCHFGSVDRTHSSKRDSSSASTGDAEVVRSNSSANLCHPRCDLARLFVSPRHPQGHVLAPL